jgi:hypothetical protein
MILLFIGFWSIGFLSGTAFWVWRFTDIFKSYNRERNDFIKTIDLMRSQLNEKKEKV